MPAPKEPVIATDEVTPLDPVPERTPDNEVQNATPESISQTEGVLGKGALSRDALVKDALAKEVGGQKGPEPTRYGDWEKNGRCTDF